MRNEGGRPVRITLCPLRRFVEHPGQIAVGIETVLLRRLDQAEDHGAAPGAVGGVCKQEVLPRDHKRLDAALGQLCEHSYKNPYPKPFVIRTFL